MPIALLLLLACPKPGDPLDAFDDLPGPTPLERSEMAGLLPVEQLPEDDFPTFTLINARIMTAAGEIIDPGWMVVDTGWISTLGAGEPPGGGEGTVLDLAGRTVTPGLIDTHSHLGVYPSPRAKAHSDGNEATAPTTAGVWAEHSVWPQDPGFERAMAGGITSLQILPGSANLIGGRGVTLHLVPARGSRAMRFPGAMDGVKMACGENPKRVYGNRKSAPSTRMGNLRGQREAFMGAQAYQRKWSEYASALAAYEATEEGEAPTPPERDLDMETLVGVLNGELLPQIHCYRADDMLSMIQLSQEFGFQIRSFHHALEAYKIRDILVEQDISASTWADWWGFKMEAYDGVPANAAMLSDAGGRPIIHSDSSVDIQRLNQEAAKAWRSGLDMGLDIDADEALRWITVNPAWALGIEDQVGTLEAGKRADLVVWTGDPFSVYTHAELVFVDGILRYDRDHPGEPWSDLELGQGVFQ